MPTALRLPPSGLENLGSVIQDIVFQALLTPAYLYHKRRREPMDRLVHSTDSCTHLTCCEVVQLVALLVLKSLTWSCFHAV